MRDFVLYASMAVLAAAAAVALRRRAIGIINESGLRVGLVLSTALMALLALKSLAQVLL